jgi:hypothetical protein
MRPMGTVTEPQDPTPFDVKTGEKTPVGPGWAGSTFDPHVIDFGHYAGRTLDDIAETDTAFLYWLARHPSGARYREEIARVLGARQAPVEY